MDRSSIPPGELFMGRLTPRQPFRHSRNDLRNSRSAERGSAATERNAVG